MLIKTKFIGPTNHKGSRIKAISATGRFVIIPWANELGIEANHASARTVLKTRLVSDGCADPVKWVMRQDRDGTMIQVGLHKWEMEA